MVSNKGVDDARWADERAARWAAQWESLNRQLAPVTDVLLRAAALQPGERVLDVGCGTGPTTRLVASSVGVGGSVVGVDIAKEMLEVARSLPAEDGAAAIEWVQADAMTWPGVGDPFDLVLSRFGVMFFDDPVAAFTNLRRLTGPAGRLCIATWGRRPASRLFEMPLSIVRSHMDAWGLDVEVPADDTGGFSLHESALREVLDRSGWREVSTRPQRLGLPAGGGTNPAEAAEASLSFGPARVLADALTHDQRDEVTQAVASAYAEHLDRDGCVVLEASIIVTTARP